MSLESAVDIIVALDQLTVTMSESSQSDDGYALCSMPPFVHKQAPDMEDGVYIVSTLSEADAFKRQAIEANPEGLEPVYDGGVRRARLSRCKVREAKLVANLFFIGKYTGLIRHMPNPSVELVHEQWEREGGEGDPTRDFIEEHWGKDYIERYLTGMRQRGLQARFDEGQ